MKRCAILAILVVLLSLPLFAQMPSGTLSGHVSDGKAPLPGVTVTATSPNLQGARTAPSTVNGDYILEMLPPGPYTVKFDLEGFETIETTVKISGDQTSTVDAVMPQVTKVAEAVTVTGRYDTVSGTVTNAVTYESKFIDKLPVIRDVSSYVDLTPGTVQVIGAPQYLFQIAGAAGHENLNLLNGAVANENYGGYMVPLFIEDAVQETTISQANVSAEYGRFTGGVVSVLTKSGGNDFHGSVRLNLTNPKWTAPTPLTIERTDETDKVWEGTFGGYVLKDRLWFFLGGRTATTTESEQTYPPVSIPYDTSISQDRYEGKLTWALSESHRLVGSYLDIWEIRRNRNAGYDLASLYTWLAPESGVVLNYSGVLSNSFFLEGQYSARDKAYEGYGTPATDFVGGTPVIDLYNNWTAYNAPYFCFACPGGADRRNNSDAFAKASVFVSTANAGSHDLRFGLDLFDDMWRVNNYQTGSGYLLYANQVNIVGTGTSALYYPVILPDQAFLEYMPILQTSRGSHFKTESGFVNDVWRLDNHFSFNIGVRFDKNDGTDASGTRVVTSSKWSPRLSVTWDPRGDGDTQVTLGYAEYVAGIDNGTAGGAAVGGQPADVQFTYEGPAINATGNDVQTPQALQQVFAWLTSIGGPMANPQLWFYAYAPGYSLFIGNDLRSPSTNQWALGVAQRLGTRGLVRVDLLDKNWTDFYSYRQNMTTGRSTDPYGNTYDRMIVENDPNVRRRYQAVMAQGDYRFGDRLHLGGNYTLSRLYGTDCSVTNACWNSLEAYPEYRQLSWYAPEGDLYGDRRHKLNLYASWDALSTKAASLNVSALQRVISGAPYGAQSCHVSVGQYVTNPGYATPPQRNCYWFTAPDGYRTASVASTDLAATLTFKVGAGVEIYINPQVQNVFNRQAVVNPNTQVYVNRDEPDTLAAFNPFTTKPIECPQNGTAAQCQAMGANWQKGPNFGKAVLLTDYQTPRTFLLNVGVRF